MYEDFIGKKLTLKEIFEMFPDHTVLGEPDRADFENLSIIIRVIGTHEEIKALFNTETTKGLGIYHGKHSRKGDGVLYNSSYTLQDLTGEWNTSVTADGGMRNETMVLCSDGTGGFSESGPAWTTPLTWYVEDDILTICSDRNTLYHKPIQYKRDVIVPCMSGEERHFTSLKGAYGLTFYRQPGITTLEEAEANAETGRKWLFNE